jgi:hypothetical protein
MEKLGSLKLRNSPPFLKLCGEKWQFEIVLYLSRFEAALKSEIRIFTTAAAFRQNVELPKSCAELLIHQTIHLGFMDK